MEHFAGDCPDKDPSDEERSNVSIGGEDATSGEERDFFLQNGTTSKSGLLDRPDNE